MALPRLQHDPRQERDPAASESISWVSELGCWCVFDPTIVVRILKSPDFVVADFAEHYRALDRKLGIDCSPLVRALQHVGIANEGQCHARIRNDTARLITDGTSSAKMHALEAVQRTVSETCVAGATVDLMRDVVRPACDALFDGLLGIACPSPGAGVAVSQVFDLYLGLNRHKQINARAGAMLQEFSSTPISLTTSPEYAIALIMLGYDSIAGSLGSSLLTVLRQPMPLCNLNFPKTLSVTAVPYVERFAHKNCKVASADIRKGNRIRLYLDARDSDNQESERKNFFGGGRHSCLGEELSTWLWLALTCELSKLRFTCTIVGATRRKPDWVFNFYSSIAARFDE